MRFNCIAMEVEHVGEEEDRETLLHRPRLEKKAPGNVPQKTLCDDNGLSVSFTRTPTWCKGARQAETRTSFKEPKPSVPTGHAFVLVCLLQDQTRPTTLLHRSFDGTGLTLGRDGP